MNRIKLVNTLIELQSDEFMEGDVMYLTNEQIVDKIIECAIYYKNN